MIIRFLVLLCIMLLFGCSDYSYSSKDFTKHATGDMNDTKLGSLMLDFVKDLAKDNLTKEEKNAVFKVATNIFIGEKIKHLKNNEPFVDIFRFSKTSPTLLESQILHGIEKEGNAFPIFNRYRCRIKGVFYLNGIQIDSINSIGDLFLGFDTIVKLKHLKEDRNTLKFKGEVTIIDSSNKQILYSRSVDISQQISKEEK